MRITVRFLGATLVALLVACNETPKGVSSAASSATPAPTASATAAATSGARAAPRPQKDLVVTVDGKPVEMVTALATLFRGAITVRLSSVPLSCDDGAGNGRLLAPDEVTFDVTFGDALEKDGTMSKKATQLSMPGWTTTIEKPAKIAGNGAEGATTIVEIDFTVDPTANQPKKIAAKGKIDAIGCPEKKSARPPPPPPTDLSMEIASKKFPVQSAWLSDGSQGKTLRLYSGLEACKAVREPGPVLVEVVFRNGKPWQVALRGTAVPHAADQTFDPKKVAIALPESGAGEADVAIDLVMNGYPLKVKGKVPVETCKE